MAKEFSFPFYKSKAWEHCRKSYSKSVGGLCENCLAKGIVKAGRIVHHIVPLTPQNISNPAITLGWDNLKLLCMDCHAEVHNRQNIGYKFDEDGNIIET